jgi:hypothetical protein
MTEPSTAELVRRYSVAVDGFIADADRTRYESKLFDMRRRTLIGQYCLADHLVPFLKEALDGVDRTALARSLRRPVVQPSAQLIHAMPWVYLVPRQNEIELGRRDGAADDPDLSWLMSLWFELATAYYDRDDDALLPSEMGDTQLVLDPPQLDPLVALLDGSREVDEAQRLAARLEMLNFVISGEIRGRIFYHGPYPGPREETRVVIQEFTQLDRRHQPWTEGLLGYPLDNVVIVREVDPGDYAFDLYGFMADRGGDFRAGVRSAALATVEDGTARPLTDAELERLAADIRASIKGAYARFAGWDDDFRITYGIYHYLFEAAPYAEIVNRPDLIPPLREKIEASAAERLPDIKAMDDVAPVWQHWRDGGGFTPPRS